MNRNLRVTALLLLLAAVGLCVFGLWRAGKFSKSTWVRSSETEAQEVHELFLGAEQLVRSNRVKEAVGQYRVAASKGHAPSQYELGRLLVRGEDGINRDLEEGTKWLREAAKRKEPQAAGLLGDVYSGDYGGKLDLKLALQFWMEESSLTNNRAMSRALALMKAGHTYINGTNGIPSDQARGREIISRAVSEFRNVSEDEGGKYEVESSSGQRHEANAFIAAQLQLGQMLCDGDGIRTDPIQGAECFRKAAEKGSPHGQAQLGNLFENGIGVPKSTELALKWYRAAAEQWNQDGQLGLGRLLLAGNDTSQNRLEAYKWFNLAAMGGNQEARVRRDELEKGLKPEEIARAQWFSLLFVRGAKLAEGVTNIVSEVERRDQLMTATGFFVTTEGHLVTAHHAVKQGKQFYVVDDQDLYAAKLLKADSTNDLALLLIEGRLRSWPEEGSTTRFVMPVTKKFKPLAISETQPRLGQPVATVGFPNPTLQGFKPKVTRGEVSGTAGIADDPRFVQISVPVQPGNSGGPLLDDQGNVIGVVCAELWAGAALATSGSLPQNVNYAVRGSLLKSLLASVAGITSPQPRTEKLHNDLPAIAEMAVESVAIVIASSAEPPKFTVREVKETK